MEPQGPATLRWIEVQDLSSVFDPQPYPPRPHRGRLAQLVGSMRRMGCLCPILARPRGGSLQVVCGFRRLLAAQAAGLESLPVMVREMSDEDCRRAFAEENTHREPAGAAPASAESAVLVEDQAASLRRILRRPSQRISTVELTEASLAAARGPQAGAAAAPDPGSSPSVPGGEPPPEAAIPIDPSLHRLARRNEQCFRSIASLGRIPVEEVEEIASELIRLGPIRAGLDLRSLAAAGGADWVPSHSLMTAGLGIHFAESLGWTPGQVKKFALACLLHDVGMLFVPRACLLAPGPLASAQRAALERHPEVGREIIQGSRAWGAQIHLVAQDHHERWDGSGYPARKKGKEVDLPARIVGFLDVFAALVSLRPHRPALLYSQALRCMAASTEMGHHEPALLSHFRNIFTDLPVGSFLRLDDGRLGRVVGADPRNPRRHRVRLQCGGALWIEPEAVVEIPPPLGGLPRWAIHPPLPGPGAREAPAVASPV